MRKIVSLCLMLVMSMMIWADRTLYFVPNSNWTQANAKFAVYCFENEESEWSDFMTLVAGETNVYTTTIPDSYTQVIFCRMDGAATECGWGSKWNQSADITLPTDGKDMFTLADGWDQISGTWSNYAAPQQQDTTNVSPLADKHFYLNGEFLNWDTQRALEFTLADSLFTLTVDTLSGIFKVMTARNWEAPDYGGDYNVNLTLGVPYTLTERGYNLSCSTIYLNAELQLRLVGNDVILTLVSGTPVQQDTTGTNPQDTTQVEMITYYAVNTPRWSLPYAYVWDDVLGAYRTWPGEVMDQTGINFRGYEVFSYTMPKEYTMMIINNGKGGDNNQTPDMVLDTTLRYMYNLQWYASLEAIPADQQDTTGGEPQDTTIVTAERYYLVGLFNNWDASAAVEFQNMDSLYTLTLDTLKGEFKVIDAQDWAHNIYGAWSAFDIPLGGNYGLFNSTKSVNLTLDGDYTNVTLNLKKNGNDLFLFFVDGTLIPQDTTATPEPQDSTDVEMITYYAVNTPRWLLPYAYVWKGESESYRPWPGEAMEQTGINFRGYDVYSYTMPKEFTKMVINNAKGGDNNQTPDMVLDTTLRYMYNLQWYASLEAIPADQQDTTGGEPQDTTTVAEITVYTVMPEGWATLNAYVWPDEGANYVAWPGEAMTPTGLVFRNAAVYSYTFPANYTHIIFNNGEGGQTANMDVNPATPYFYKGEWYASFYDAPAEQEPEYITIYTVKPEGWVALNAYAWGLNYNYMDWPGVPMTNTGEVFRGDSVYAVLLTDQCTKIIFNEGMNGAQTRDINIESGKYCYYADQWFASWDSVPEEIVVVPATYYIMGNDNLILDLGRNLDDVWNPAAIKAESDTMVLNLFAGKEYQMMLSLNGQWGEGNIKSFDDLTEVTTGVVKNHFGYIAFTLAEDGQVTVIYNDSVFTILGNFIVPEPVENITIYTTLPTDWNAIRAYVWNDESAYFAWPGEAMTNTGETFRDASVYSFTFPVIYNQVIFNDGNGKQTSDLTIDTTMLYYYGNTWYASWEAVPADQQDTTGQDSTLTPVEPHYYLVGGFNSWNQNTAIEFARQDSVYTVTIDTLFGSMKVLVSRETWEGNYGVPSQDDAALTLGEPKALVAYIDGVSYSYDFNVEGTILNAVLNFVVTENGATITLVSGTPYVAPIEDTHYYFIGSVNSWNFETAPEFTYADSIYTLSLDSLYGNFKVTGAHDWNHGNYGAHTSGDVLLLGGEYQMASANSQDLWIDGTYTNVVLALTNTNNILTIHFVQGTLVQDTVAPQPQPENYYIKNNWNGGEWAWRQMEEVGGMSDDTIVTFWGYTDVFGGVGVNISTAGDNTEPDTWYAISDFIIADGDLVPQAMDSVSFIYDAVNHLVYAFVINRPGVDPLNPDTIVPQPEKHYYLVGQFNGWDVATALEFTNADSLFTLTVDTLRGAFKVMTARNWEAPDYGGDYDVNLTLGVPYTLTERGSNLSCSTIYLNAELQLRLVGNDVILTLVSGTPYVEPVEEKHFYLVGQFNGWSMETAPEFVYQDAVYTLTVDTLLGEFKVVGARDWVSGNYGAYNFGDVLNMGAEYIMWNDGNSQNLNVSGVYTNATLNLTYVNNVVTIIFVSGTPVPTTGLDTTVGNTATPVKLIENGALIILRDGVKYNAAGQRIR